VIREPPRVISQVPGYNLTMIAQPKLSVGTHYRSCWMLASARLPRKVVCAGSSSVPGSYSWAGPIALEYNYYNALGHGISSFYGAKTAYELTG
jgi:hypothetical protein